MLMKISRNQSEVTAYQAAVLCRVQKGVEIRRSAQRNIHLAFFLFLFFF